MDYYSVETNKKPNQTKKEENSMNAVVENQTEQAVEVKRKVGRPVSKVTLKRVVLLDGKVVGRGRPKTNGKGNRTVVYIPASESYDSAKHGVGVKFSPGLKQFRASIKRVDIKKYDALVKQSA